MKTNQYFAEVNIFKLCMKGGGYYECVSKSKGKSTISSGNYIMVLLEYLGSNLNSFTLSSFYNFFKKNRNLHVFIYISRVSMLPGYLGLNLNNS